MRTILKIIAVIFALCMPSVALAERNATPTDSLLMGLDRVLRERPRFQAIKEARMDSLRQTLRREESDQRRFDLLGELFGEYLTFNTDSAYAINLRREAIAHRCGNPDMLMNVALNRANVFMATGMYLEAYNLMQTIDRRQVSDYLVPYYYHTMRTIYGNLTDYAAFQPAKSQYDRITDLYRDSLLTVNDSNSIYHVLIKTDQLNVRGKPSEAISLMTDFIGSHPLTEHERAILAFTLSDSYKRTGDTANQKRQLILASIADMKSAVREYIALRQLALLLYQEGDLERAYEFLGIAMEDAAKCNARQRIVELNDAYPMINGIYISKIRSQKRSLERTIWIITILSVGLVGLLVYLRKQMLRIAQERRKVEEANAKLNELNSRLTDSNTRLNESNEMLNRLNTRLSESNTRLHDANCAIAEISELKEVYIGRYMDQSLAYIELLDAFRKNVGKLLNSGKTDELKRLVKSTAMVDDELKTFYDQFDTTFLSLFPTFVEDFNNLLQPQEAIIPKKPGTLTTELRIFALIRLGITDSDKIAKFLRYSLTTIYNYRTKVRNKARGDRNLLEQEVGRIGRN